MGPSGLSTVETTTSDVPCLLPTHLENRRLVGWARLVLARAAAGRRPDKLRLWVAACIPLRQRCPERRDQSLSRRRAKPQAPGFLSQGAARRHDDVIVRRQMRVAQVFLLVGEYQLTPAHQDIRIRIAGAIDKLLVDCRYLLRIWPILLSCHGCGKVGREALEFECVRPVFAVPQRYLTVLDAVRRAVRSLRERQRSCNTKPYPYREP